MPPADLLEKERLRIRVILEILEMSKKSILI